MPTQWIANIRWRRKTIVGCVPICLAWNFLLAKILFSNDAHKIEDPDFLIIICFWGIVAILVTYTGLAALSNRSVLIIANGLLTVRHGPLPWFVTNKNLNLSVIQIFATEAIQGRRESYLLKAIMIDGTQEKIIINFIKREDPLRLTLELNEQLNAIRNINKATPDRLFSASHPNRT